MKLCYDAFASNLHAHSSLLLWVVPASEQLTEHMRGCRDAVDAGGRCETGGGQEQGLRGVQGTHRPPTGPPLPALSAPGLPPLFLTTSCGSPGFPFFYKPDPI